MRSMMLAKAAIFCIGGYRRYVSPHKGYGCAYRAATGRSSCSRYAQQAIGKRGVWNGIRLLRRRFERCALAAAAVADGPAKLQKEKFFGECDPAVQEFNTLCCRGFLGALCEGLAD